VTSFRRTAAVLGLLAFAVALFVAPRADAVKVRVRGGSTIKLVAIDGADETTLRGQITDDVGATIGRVTLKVEALGDGGRTVRMGPPRPCDLEDGGSIARSDGDGYSVSTDERGSFCVRKPGAASGLQFRAKFVGNNFYEASDSTVSPTPEGEQRVETVLKFESPPSTVDLDKTTATFVVSLRVDREAAARLLAPAQRREGLALEMKDERGAVVARTTTGGDGRGRFEVATADLDGPGHGELTVNFAGDRQLSPSRATAFVTRAARASLDAPDSAVGDPDEGIPLDVEVSTSRGAVDGGIVEAVMEGASVGAGRVEGGSARVVVTFVGGAAAKVPVTLRYVPSSPFFVAGPVHTVDVRVQGPSPARQAILAAVGLALAVWIVAKWRRAPKVDRADSVLPPPPSGRPEILVLDRPSGLKGWRGVVNDAHEGYPIADAELRIEVPSFEGRGVLASARTDREGRFSLDVEAPREARLIVEGDLHATYEQPLPGPSVLRVNLVTRRRALLDRLVRWARGRGMPFDSSKEPTPGHVRRVAARTGASPVEMWATKLERAAFGPEAVTRSVEQDVASAEPTAPRADDRDRR
jgi:hypothetical protein